MRIKSQYLSLSVKNIEKSLMFYERLGYKPVEGAGSIQEKWLLLDNGHLKIGLFQDMFDTNIITVNPENGREIFQALVRDGVEVISKSKTIEDMEGPCHFMVHDPDGNRLLIDQFK